MRVTVMFDDGVAEAIDISKFVELKTSDVTVLAVDQYNIFLGDIRGICFSLHNYFM